jgi:hypothetical protein
MGHARRRLCPVWSVRANRADRPEPHRESASGAEAPGHGLKPTGTVVVERSSYGRWPENWT